MSELEEKVKQKQAEKETLQREIDEGRAILDGTDVDVESRRKLVEEYTQMKHRYTNRWNYLLKTHLGGKNH
ncbi:MAG: hypothetical protein WA667_07035 [Candidatus Nitrosopolaris sp.]